MGNLSEIRKTLIEKVKAEVSYRSHIPSKEELYNAVLKHLPQGVEPQYASVMANNPTKLLDMCTVG